MRLQGSKGSGPGQKLILYLLVQNDCILLPSIAKKESEKGEGRREGEILALCDDQSKSEKRRMYWYSRGIGRMVPLTLTLIHILILLEIRTDAERGTGTNTGTNTGTMVQYSKVQRLFRHNKR